MARQKKLSPTNLNNKLTLDDLLKETDRFEELEKVTFDDGRHTFIYKYFSPTRIDAALASFGEFIAKYIERNGELTESKTLDYLNLHIILHFSQLTDGLDHTYEETVIILDKMLDSDLAEKIVESFDEKEIEKIYTRTFKKIEKYQEIVKGNKEVQKKFREEVLKSSNLENKELIMATMFGETYEETTGNTDANI